MRSEARFLIGKNSYFFLSAYIENFKLYYKWCFCSSYLILPNIYIKIHPFIENNKVLSFLVHVEQMLAVISFYWWLFSILGCRTKEGWYKSSWFLLNQTLWNSTWEKILECAEFLTVLLDCITNFYLISAATINFMV